VAVLPTKTIPHVTVQLTLVPVGGVSTVKVRVSQSLVPISPVGVQLQRSVTAAECQASHSTGESPTLQEAATLFARASPGAASKSTAMDPATASRVAVERLPWAGAGCTREPPSSPGAVRTRYTHWVTRR
jgi:hypothetical protein